MFTAHHNLFVVSNIYDSKNVGKIKEKIVGCEEMYHYD